MRQVRLASFVEQEQRFALRFTCEHCTYFHVERERCMHGYPNAEHREERYRSAQSVEPGEQGEEAPLVFCKEFELV